MMTRPGAQLTVVEATLEELEARVGEAEQNAYHVRGLALAEIRAGALWRKRYNGTFEEYCEQRWEMDDSRARQLIDAAGFAEKCDFSRTSVPSRETHVRPLLRRLKGDEEAQLAVWRNVLETVNNEPRNVKAKDVEDAIDRFVLARDKPYITLDEWQEMDAIARAKALAVISDKTLNEQKNADIEWADWSWNPVTGCLHGCPYCYARDIAFSIYPAAVGFGATLWPDRLTAPANQRVPARDDVAAKNIFTCSMADLFGRWVPDEWIEQVLTTVTVNPKWNFLFLTKFPKRMSEFDIPGNAWMGTTVDVQARVANAERAFEKVKAPIRWLSIEPLLEPLKFDRLDLFDWIVIGGASESKAIDGSPATPVWNPPMEWLADLHSQARAANCKIYYKTNSGLAGMTRIREFPGRDSEPLGAPEVFNYLGHIPQKERIG